MENRGLLSGGVVLLVLALARVGIESLPRHDGSLPAGESRLEALMGKSQAAREEEEARTRPMAPGERLDPNRASEADFDRLPGVGPATARAIGANRDQHGGFTRLEDLLRIPGIGPAKLERMAPFLDFSRGVPLDLTRRSGARLPAAGNPGSVQTGGGATDPEKRRVRGATGLGSGLIDVNRDSEEDLQRLPGIGPALADRIVESRKKEGLFRVPEDLLRVKGIGPAKLARLLTLIELGR